MQFVRALVALACCLAACADSAAEAPRVDAITPARTCDVATGATRVLRLSGAGLAPRVVDTLTGSARLVLPQVTLVRVSDASGAPIGGAAPVAALAPRYLATGEIELTLPAGVQLPTGKYDVVVTDEHGRAGTLHAGLTIAPPAAAFFVDPAIAWNEAEFGLTGWLDAPGTAVTAVHLQRHGDASTRQTLAPLAAMAPASRFEVTLPHGLAEGDYDLIVDSEGGCVGESDSIVHVKAQLTPVLGNLEPDTGTASASFPVAMLGAGYAPTPRLFARRSNDPGSPATPLVALDFQSAARVDAVVPAGLNAGLYDVIVLAADGSVGLLASALTVVSAEQLDVETVAPQVMPTMIATPIAIHGKGFDAPTVKLRCRRTPTSPAVPVQLSVMSANATDIVATAPASPMPATCVVRVINGTGAVAQYSAIAYANGPAEAGLTDLPAKRRAPGAAVVRVRDRHVLYVIGGDGGAPASALASVDSCKFDLFGRPVACPPQRSHLTVPRSFVGAARVGRFVYAVGGENADGPLATIERARVLDPADAPAMAAFDLALADGTHGLIRGQWIYRVSAILDENDVDDPGGETLASQPALIDVPDRAERVAVTLSWAPVPHAAKYRIFRTPRGGAASGDELLVHETSDTATSWTDAGEPATGVAPLKPLQLSDWHTVAPQLSVPRAGAAVLVASDPGDPKISYLYVAGGRDASGPRDDFELFTLTDEGPGRQRIDGPTQGGSIGGARAQLAAWAVTSADVPDLDAGATWLYLGGGEGVGGVRVAASVAARVPAGGKLSFASVTSTPVPETGGSAALVQRSGLVLLGGGGSPSRTGASADVCLTPAATPGCGGVGQLGNWSSLSGDILARARYLAGTVRSGPFVFIAGGTADGEPATASVEGGAW